MNKTPSGYPLSGDKLYQVRARKALPLLVRQAKAEQLVFYSDLANELGMPNPRNVNYVLDAVNKSLEYLGEERDENIPAISCLVVNKSTGLPGKGFAGFVPEKYRDDFKKGNRRTKERIVHHLLHDVFQYSGWDNVLKAFGLKPTRAKLNIIPPPEAYTKYGSRGEGEDHKALKKFVSKHPWDIKLPSNVGRGEMENGLRSGDAVDVLFTRRDELIGVEVKPKKSNASEIERGVFQCVKYKALLEAEQKANQRKPNARTILVLEGTFPKDLLGLRNTLGVEVCDEVDVP